jgi:phage baseplate assembly protein gpV
LVAGDEVILGFFERAIDRWMVEGGTQPPVEFRLHDLSDGFCVPGVSNLTRVIPGFKTDAVQMRNREGSAYVQINTSGEVEIDGTLLRVKCPVIAEQPATFESLVTYQAGMVGSGGTGSSIQITGNVQFSGGSLTHNGKNIGSTHIHSNGNGGANTGGPV